MSVLRAPSWTAFAICLTLLAGSVRGQETGPVVVELFTSQGCSACPPADESLAELAGHDDVLALSLHVDYWDYIGWEDSFALPRLTERQRAYARGRESGVVYTPQFVVNGTTRMPGDKPMKLAMVIEEYAGMTHPAELRLDRDDQGRLEIRANLASPLDRPATVQLVRFTPRRTVRITDGENAGRSIDYVNIVTQWRRIATWEGAAPLTRTVEIAGDGEAAVIIQEAGQGAVLGAARLR